MKWTLRPPADGAASLRRGLLRLRNLTGYIALTLVLFVFFVWLSLPTRAIAWRISHEIKKRGYIVDIEDLSISPFGGITLRNLTWTYAPSRAGQIPRSFFAETIDVEISLLRLLFGSIHVEVATEVDEGTITAKYARDDEHSEVKIDIEELPLYSLPKLQQSVNAPLRGTFGLHVDLDLPEDKFANAVGTIDISCSACRIGDGETLVFIPGVSRGVMTKGITLPEIDFGNLKGRLAVAEGKAKTEGISTESDDFKLSIVGQLLLSDPFPRSALEFDIKMLLSESLQAESDPLRLMVQTRSPSTYLDPPEEDWMGFKLRGTVSRPEFIGIKSKTRAERIQERKDKARAKSRAAAAKRSARPKAAAKKPTPPPTPNKPPSAAEGEIENTARNTPDPEDSSSVQVVDMAAIDTARMVPTLPDPSRAGGDDDEDDSDESSRGREAKAEAKDDDADEDGDAETTSESGGGDSGGGDSEGGGSGSDDPSESEG